MQSLHTLRKCTLLEYRVDMAIGCLDEERGHTQPVLFTVDVYTPLEPLGMPLTLTSIYDYSAIARAVDLVVSRGHIDLQESAHDALFVELFRDPRVRAARIRTAKPAAYSNATAACVETFRINPNV
ncbi:MAG: dihydroneopterin aldolase [Duodenibacillus sp.]